MNAETDFYGDSEKNEGTYSKTSMMSILWSQVSNEGFIRGLIVGFEY